MFPSLSSLLLHRIALCVFLSISAPFIIFIYCIYQCLTVVHMTNSHAEMVNAFRVTENVTENVIAFQMAKMNRYVYAIQVSFCSFWSSGIGFISCILHSFVIASETCRYCEIPIANEFFFFFFFSWMPSRWMAMFKWRLYSYVSLLWWTFWYVNVNFYSEFKC